MTFGKAKKKWGNEEGKGVLKEGEKGGKKWINKNELLIENLREQKKRKKNGESIVFFFFVCFLSLSLPLSFSLSLYVFRSIRRKKKASAILVNNDECGKFQ